jgi:predicted aspartyl protease
MLASRLPLQILLTVPVTGQPAATLAARVTEAEAVVARHYRGEPLEVQRRRVTADIAAFNAETAAAKQKLEAAKAALDAKLKPLRELEGRLEALDQKLAKPPVATESRTSPAEVAFEAALKERKACFAQHQALRDAVEPHRAAYNTQVQASNEAMTARRAAVIEAQKAVNARVDALAAFRKGNGEVAFYAGLTKLLGDCRKAGDPALLARVRGLRRELFAYAQAWAASEPFGPILVEVRIGDEAACLMVDTGAMRTGLSPELAGVLGLPQGEEATMVLAGGSLLRGRTVVLPEVTVSGVTAREVPAVLFPATEVGIDGLLGQTFLKGFTYSVDEGSPEKLRLKPRRP